MSLSKCMLLEITSLEDEMKKLISKFMELSSKINPSMIRSASFVFAFAFVVICGPDAGGGFIR